MKNRIKALTFLFFLIIIVYFSNTSYASQDENTSIADYLKEMGLFKGTGDSYDLEKATNRAQGATMVVRLLGKEEEALSMKYSHPFQDVPVWASPYVGYLWHYQISNGIDELHYGANKLINASEYMTFLIRILGYNDKAGDFSWDKSLEKAYSIGIIDLDNYKLYKSNNAFLRGDMVYFSYKVLIADLKSEKGITLVRKLTNDNIVPQDAILKYKYAPYDPQNINLKPSNNLQLQKSIIESIMAFEKTVTFDLTKGKINNITDNLDQAILELRNLPGYSSIINSWSYSTRNNKLTVGFEYRTSKNQFMQAKGVAEDIIRKLINSNMSDYERELLIHDYIVDRTSYHDYQGNNNVFTMHGVFVDKKAVCQGYADAFYYLCTLAGIDSVLVFGDTIDENGKIIPHAWNVVRIEGDWYQVDATWDDPVSSDGKNQKSYQYFNITDKEIRLDHKWNEEEYPICNSTKNNYYYVNNLIVIGQEGLKNAINDSIKRKKSEAEYKVIQEKISSEQVISIVNSFQTLKGYFYYVNELKGIVKLSNIMY